MKNEKATLGSLFSFLPVHSGSVGGIAIGAAIGTASTKAAQRMILPWQPYRSPGLIH
ncbi:hypothetical protein [Pseudomonas songnenensis]|jgi:hypothetical protein|uniref:hypothetical protein n=1 Tax=Pseudomonas songnenensis TaxID=1176259 RepID=UPI0013ED3DB0|nr:hypothetical protein [Pseudomonas songnenensis]